MSAPHLLKLIEELVDLKIRQHASSATQATIKANPQLAKVVSYTKFVDRGRIDEVRQEIVQILEGQNPAA